MRYLRLLTILALCLVWAAGVQAATSADELVFGTTSDVVGMSPVLTNDTQSSAINDQIYETLFTREIKDFGKVVPLLAESYETPDDTTWIIKLKKGIKFHDGTDFNAQAVVFTFQRIVDPKVASPRASILGAMESVKALDDYTVELKTKYAYGPMLACLAHTNTAIVSPTAVQKYGDLMNNPVGTGPFKFAKRVPGNFVTLEANQDYWGGAPKLKTFTFKVVPEISSLVAMLETGEIDFLLRLPPEQLDRLKANPNIEVVMEQGTRIQYLGFNHKFPPLDNLKVRQAIAHAVDRELFISTLNGTGYFSSGIIGPQVFGYTKEVEAAGYAYDPEKAKALLKEAGFENGFDIVLYTSNRPEYMSMAEIIQAQLAEVGIKAELNVMEWGAYLGATRKHEHQLFLLGWSNLTVDGSELIYPNLHSDNLESSDRSNYTNEEICNMILETRTNLDQTKRLDLLNKANIALVKDVAMIPLCHMNVVYAYRNNVKGLQVFPNDSILVTGVTK